MADITKMFVHFNGTQEAFKAISGNEAKYANSIVFISGNADGGSCIYTHNKYFATVSEALKEVDALEQKVNNLKYVSGIKVGDKTYTLPAGGGVIPFVANDPNVIDISVENGTVTFSLSTDFVNKVNSTASNLGNSTDASNVATAWGRINKNSKAITLLDASVKSSFTQHDTSISALDASMQAAFTKNGNQDSSISALDASVKALVNKDTSIDASISALDASIEEAFTKNTNQDSSISALDASVKALANKDASLDSSIDEINGKLDASIASAVSKNGENNGVKVTVTTTKGVVSNVVVDASGVVTDGELAALTDTKSGSDASSLIGVTVTTTGGNVSSVTVDGSSLIGEINDIFGELDNKADLDESGKILATQLPDYILGQVLFGGTINGTGVIEPSALFESKYPGVSGSISSLQPKQYEGVYFIATANRSANGGIPAYNTGDWVISSGNAWTIVDNTDAVSSVAGLSGAITASALAAKLADTKDANELALKSELDASIQALVNKDASIDASLSALFRKDSSIDTSIQALDASIKALINKDASIDDSIQVLIDKDASIDTSIQALINKDASIDTSIQALDTSIQSLISKDASIDASLSALSKKDASIDASIQALINKDSSIDTSIQALIDKDASIDASLRALSSTDASLDASIKANQTSIANLTELLSWEEING